MLFAATVRQGARKKGCWEDIKQGGSREREKEKERERERERERESKKQACATLDGQQLAPRRKQRETIGHCFESGEAIVKKRGKDVDVGVEGKYLGGGGAIQRKRKRERRLVYDGSKYR